MRSHLAFSRAASRRLLTAAWLLAAGVAAPARADVINLVCNDKNYWVDTDRGSIIYPDGGELKAEISAQTIRYHLKGAGNVQVEISRTTGLMTIFNSDGSPAFSNACTKGSTPLPEAKF